MSGDNVYMNDKSSSVFESFDWEDLIEQIAHRLRCEQPAKDEEGVMVWKPIMMGNKKVAPLMNEMGIGHVIAMITGVCQRITAFSNVDDKDIERIFVVLRQHSDGLIKTLGMNYTVYEIKSSDHMPIIWECVMDYIEFAVLHAVNEGSKMFVAKAVSERQIQQIAPMPQDKDRI